MVFLLQDATVGVRRTELPANSCGAAGAPSPCITGPEHSGILACPGADVYYQTDESNGFFFYGAYPDTKTWQCTFAGTSYTSNRNALFQNLDNPDNQQLLNRLGEDDV